jgi:UDP-2,3-diacylglucosamine pyrophosphatase LpxH
MSTIRNKRIFISDIHMGDDRSMTQPHPYGWLRKNIPNLENFLAELLHRPDVAEVVILGDMFDEWVIPVDADPLSSFDAICNNPSNAKIIANIKALAASADIALSYVPGNHDMSMASGDIALTKSFMQSTFTGIHFICDSNVPLGAYRRGKLVAEHGNRYCLFNAPDRWRSPASFLPLGYFMARAVAYKVAKTGKEEDFLVILANFIEEFKDHPNFVKDLFDAVAADANIPRDLPFDMGSIAGFQAPVTVDSVETQYEHLIENWEKDPGTINLVTAIIGDVGDLSPAATLTYFSIFGADTNIVIFGHTHKADMTKHFILAAVPPSMDIHMDLPCRAIYANSGTWVDSAKYCTYVETEENADAGRHYVRVMTYPSKTCLQESFVRL